MLLAIYSLTLLAAVEIVFLICARITQPESAK